MRIADYTRVWTTHGLGGMQIRASLVAKGLARRGHEVHVFTTSLPRSRVEEHVDGGVHVHYIAGTAPKLYQRPYFEGALKLFRDIGGFDVIHSNSTAGRAHLGGSLPVVATWHGLGSGQDDENIRKIGGFPREPKLGVIRFDPSIRLYNQSVVVGPHEARLLEENGVPAERIHIVLTGLDSNAFAPHPAVRARVRSACGIGPRDFVAGLAGRFVFDKGVAQVLEALEILDGSVKVLAVGEGSALRVHPGIRDRVIHVPGVPHCDMPAYYNAMDVLVNASARHQGFDLTITEALLCGVPVIVAESCPARELLVCGAEFFPLGHTARLAALISGLSRRPSRLAVLRAGARALAELLFSRERMIGDMERILGNAVPRLRV